MRGLVAVLVVAASAVVAAEPVAADDQRQEAVTAAEDFLDRYVMPSGRVARLDQGGDTVSEGQAYGMLLAAAIGDEARFRHVWAWTDQHLQRGDRLLAWRWANGGVADWTPATDADLMAAGALSLAGERFDDAALSHEAARMGSAILAVETARYGDEHVLLAGPWGRRERVVNASYFVVGMMSRLWWAGDRQWASVAASSRDMLDVLTAAPPHLPPDWSTVDAQGGNPRARASPGGESPRYGYEATRALVQLAVDCDERGRAVAARSWPFLQRQVAGRLAVAYSLTGEALDTNTHPVAYTAAAASAAAAGDGDAAANLLDVADAHDERYPTYYGAAWTALARLWLDTDLLGGCRPG